MDSGKISLITACRSMQGNTVCITITVTEQSDRDDRQTDKQILELIFNYYLHAYSFNL